ncbi:hypothetical protein [Mucilaginibacter arboris]|uniref:Uncharacterized protein n=1 Tax=Mucilaginibacter arboris TaxID=2682090 RepID=A0A7K1SXP3_9SPHI|nr:hypothetical protein [Mucilaginibacter arboris]MVN22101.1 hypothetical protein [Mucilaginibacter arboris]
MNLRKGLLEEVKNAFVTSGKEIFRISLLFKKVFLKKRGFDKGMIC